MFLKKNKFRYCSSKDGQYLFVYLVEIYNSALFLA